VTSASHRKHIQEERSGGGFRVKSLFALLACFGFGLGAAGCAGSSGGSNGRGIESDKAARLTDEWAANGGDHSEQRHSPLDQINASNVQQLGVDWSAQLPERGTWQGTPLMVDGKLIVTTPWSKAYAFDAKTGEQLWKYDPQVPRELVAGVLCCNV